MTTAIAIVTGGSKGLGRALASVLVADGWDVVLDARGAGGLDEVVAELGPGAHGLAGDVADPEHRRRLVELARSLGGLDLLVNNASALGPSPLPRVRDVGADDLRALVEVNVVAPLQLARLALPLLAERGGSLVNVTSDAAVEAYEGWGAYGASKAALDQLTSVLGLEEPGVRAWSLDPGDLRTDMQQAAYPGEDVSDRTAPEDVAPALLALLRERPPSGRVRAVALLDGSVA